MKHLKSYIIIAVLSLCLASSQHAFATQTKPVRGIDVVVIKGQDNGYRQTGSHQTATSNGDGTFTVNIPGAGTWTITYANGPKKGQVIKTVTVKKAGPVKVSATAASE